RKRFHSISFVNVQDVFLVPEELQKHASEVAKRHIISNKKRSPKLLLWRINDNYRYIRSLYKKLNEEVRLKKSVNPASEWLLDNFYIIEEQIKDVKRILKSGNDLLPILKEGYLNGYPRVYALALEMVAHTDGKVDEKVISDFIKAYQSKSLLTTREIWALGYMLRIALIENVRFLCGRINENIKQWREAEGVLDSEDILKAAKEHIKSTEINYSFVEHLLQKLRKRGREAMHIINDLRNLLAEFGVTEEQIAQIEHQYQASMEVTIGNSITSLKLLSSMDWTDIFEDLSSVEQILRKDPSGTYSRMDFASRNYYREIVEKIALNAKVSETLVAIKAVECACDVEDDERKRHVGYYLIDKGKDVLEKRIGFEAKGIHKWLKKTKEHVAFIYIGFILAITVLIELAFLSYTYKHIGKLNNLTAAIIMALVFVTVLIPASEISVSIVNWLVTRIVRPNILPKLELKDGIPDDAATFVVIPALLSDEKRVRELLFNLEKYYLANKGKNVYFALLGDFKDGPDKEMPDDDAIIDCAMSGIKELNKRYAKDDTEIFYYFHRERQYNKSQGKWMGWERKRGALLEFNDMLCGSRKTSYCIVSSDIKKLPKIKYVITLDADTQLPIDTAKELIGTIMHPLNKAIVDEKKGIVTDGYGLLQPRIGVDIVSSNHTLFARIFAGQSGIDPYTTAVSDVYQDLFGEGIYTGKGIYDVEVFQRILRDAIPDNSILSHDLLEGSYVRAGLVTDVELIDGYPARYNSYAMRLHRWVRGDWQLIPWLFSKIKNREGKVVRNPLSVVSKWKIFDNLRRSLVMPSLMVLTAMVFSVFPGNIYIWFGFILLTVAFPAVLEAFDLLLSGQIWVPKGKRFSPVITGFKAALYRALVLFIFMPYQAYLMSDAVIRTLWRVFFTRKNLMEWVTAADMERKLKNDISSSFRRMWVAVLEALAIFALDYSFFPFTWQLTLPLLALWSMPPYLAYYISLPVEREVKRLSEEDIGELRFIARKTWRYFEDFVGPDDNYLPPDNYQEDPPNGIAHRTSPTNIGLLLISTLSARDFGYLSTLKMIERLDSTISTIEKMDKWNGHLF
ncbi:MAG: glycosyl transferase, partial [Thermoanaerobacterium sp.]|nr:glycosyl transferase [Thermoanaerobacterium sp.]